MVNESSVEKFDIPNQDQIVKVDLSHISKMTRLKTICLKASRRDPQTANKSFVKLSDIHNHKDKIVKFELSHDKPAVPFNYHRTEFPIFKKLAFYQAPIVDKFVRIDKNLGFKDNFEDNLKLDNSKLVWADDMPSNPSDTDNSLLSFVQDENDSNE